MKAKILSLTLLSAIAICQTDGADRYKKMTEATEQAPKAEAKIQKGKDTAASIAPKLAVPADPKGREIDAAITDVHTKLGHDAAGGAPADHANKRVNDAIARLHAGQPDVHAGLTNVHGLLGAGGGAADIHGKAAHVQGLIQPATDLTAGAGNVAAILGGGGGAGDLHGKATHVQGLIQPGTDLTSGAGNVNTLLGGGHPVGGGAAPADAHAKATNLLARLQAIPVGHPIVAAPAAASIEAWLTAQGR